MTNEIKTIKQLRTAIKKAENVYVFNPVTEGYVKVYKNNFLLDLQDLPEDAELHDDMCSFREGTKDLYIN